MKKLTPAARLWDAIDGSTIQIPGAPNTLAARMIEAAGFEALYLSGAALSVGTLGIPDVGLHSLSDLTQQTAYFTRATELPVVVDADTGFGDAFEVERTVAELAAAGAAAIQLEDQQLPKRSGQLSGKSLVTVEEMCQKIKAAVGARGAGDVIIIARTDARGVGELDDAIRRSQMYVEAGADWVLPEALQSTEEFTAFADSIDVPLVANMTEFGPSPLLFGEELAELGYAAILYPVTLLRVAAKAMEAALAVLAREGCQEELLDIMQTRQELYDLLKYSEFEEEDRKYFGGSHDS